MAAQRKPQKPITIVTTIGEDHRLVIDIPLPADMPRGQVQVELLVRSTQSAPAEPINTALEVAREKMRVAGRLNTAWHENTESTVLDDEMLWKFVKLAPHSVSSEQLINEDRGDY